LLNKQTKEMEESLFTTRFISGKIEIVSSVDLPDLKGRQGLVTGVQYQRRALGLNAHVYTVFFECEEFSLDSIHAELSEIAEAFAEEMNLAQDTIEI